MIAEYLRLRQHRLRVATPYSDQTRALRTVVRTRTDLVEMRVAATNQLAALLDDHWPGAKVDLRRRRVPDQPWTSSPATRPRPRPPTSARNGSPAF